MRRKRNLSPILDDALIGNDDFTGLPSTHQASSSFSPNSLSSLLNKQRTAEIESGLFLFFFFLTLYIICFCVIT